MNKITIQSHEANKAAYEKAVAGVNEKINHWQTSVWVKELSAALPMFDFELHIDRWVEGVDTILYSVEYGTVSRNRFGWYGDLTGRNMNAVEQRAFAAEKWLQGEPPITSLEEQVFNALGESSVDKQEAVVAFVEIVRAYVAHGFNEELSKKWRARSKGNPVLQNIFLGEGLDRGINDGGGYWMIPKLNLILTVIGGADFDETDIKGSCNVTLRHIFRDDPERMKAAKGYLWGLVCYLKEKTIGEVRNGLPDHAGYAIKAYRSFTSSKYDRTECRLIAEKLFHTIRFWYVRAVLIAVKGEMKLEDWLLPELRKTLKIQ